MNTKPRSQWFQLSSSGWSPRTTSTAVGLLTWSNGTQGSGLCAPQPIPAVKQSKTLQSDSLLAFSSLPFDLHIRTCTLCPKDRQLQTGVQAWEEVIYSDFVSCTS